MSDYLVHAIGIKATHYLPLTSDVRSPRASYNKNDDKIHVHWTIDQTPVDTTFDGYHQNNNGDIVFNSMSVEYLKNTIKRYGTGYLNDYKDSRAVWDDGRLTQMARNMHNQLQSAMAQISNQLTGAGVRHSAIDIIDVSDTLQHAQHEGYYSPNNTSNKATPYIFEKLVKSSSGNQIGARFKGQGDRQWVEIFVPTVDFTPNMQNFIALFNAEKGNVKIREEEMRKAARLLTNFFNSPSLPGNEKMTTYVRKPKSLKHALFTEVYDMDDYLEHHGVLGMKWGVRRYQNEDGSLTDLGRKRYNVKATRAQLENAQTDAEKRLILTKSANKATAGMLGGMAGYIGGIMATAGLAAAFQTPLAVIPAAVGVTNFARSVIYGMYKEMKLSELAAEFDVSTNVTRSIGQVKSINQAVEDGMREYDSRQQSSTRGTHSYTPEQQREKLQTAKNNDRYDLDFLEFMQNTKISYDDNKTAMDKAYKEYLKDPEAFATDPDFYKKYPYA